MGKRSRQRARGNASGEPAGPLASGLGETPTGGPTSAPTRAPKSPLRLSAPTGRYTDAEGNQLELRGSLTAKARAEYSSTLAGGLNQEDAWQRATELLFERLAVSWTISGVRIDRQRELLGRYRMAGAEERRFVRDSMRAHVQENFPELQAP